MSVLQVGVRLCPAELSAADGGVLSMRKIVIGAGCHLGIGAIISPGMVSTAARVDLQSHHALCERLA